jgi:hypothetical protein
MVLAKTGAATVAATVGLIGITGGWFAVVAPVFGAVGGYAGGKRTADTVKKLLCRTEADDLAAALAEYVAVAISVLRAMIALAETQSRRFGVMGVASGTAGSALLRDWQQRIEVENSIRTAMIREFESRASRLDHGWGIGLDLIALHVEVCLTAAKAGLLPANLAPETRRLTKTSEAYQSALRKRLVAA